jgi:hypothetical protein
VMIDGRAFASMMWAAMVGFACIWVAALFLPPALIAFVAWLIEPRTGIDWQTAGYWGGGIWTAIFVWLNVVWIWRQ